MALRQTCMVARLGQWLNTVCAVRAVMGKGSSCALCHKHGTVSWQVLVELERRLRIVHSHKRRLTEVCVCGWAGASG